MQNSIEVIRPIRVDESNEFLIDRIGNFKYDRNIPSNVKFTVVDEGSSSFYLEKIKRECEKNEVNLIALDAVSELFCPGRARNFGAMLSKADYIFFQDLDLLPYDGFYNDLTDQISIANIDKDPDQFVMIPCIYLTESGNNLYDGSLYAKKRFIRASLANENDLVERYSTGTSACLYNRLRFLQIGGFDRQFIAWGYEDLDLNCRFIRKSKLFPLAKNWSSDRFNFNSVVEYDGWKSAYRLYGDINFHQGVVLFHAHHPIHKSRTDFKEIVEKNRRHFIDNLKKNEVISALPDKACGKTLLFKSCAFNSNNDFLPFLGDVVKFDDLELRDATKVMSFIENEKFTRVVFQNPYSNALTEEVYRCCKSSGIPIVICERGALPNSCFFDDDGFLADSKYYNNRYWDKPLSELEIIEVEKYCKSVLDSDSSLEKQGKRLSRIELKKKYGCLDKKIVFVPLQRPDDTAVVKFKRENNYIEFLTLVQEVASQREDLFFLIKKHPLEDNIENIIESTNLKFVDSDENINTLVQASDVVITYTSGVGLLGLLAKKRVITVGNAFYSKPGLTVNADNVAEVCEAINDRILLDSTEEQSIIRFIHYLVNDYYSFGSFKTREVKFENGKRITATTSIELNQLNYSGRRYIYPKKERVIIDFSSGLFDRYRYWMKKPSKDTNSTRVVAPQVKLENKQTLSLKERRLKKLKENPYRYFSESSWLILRLVAPIFKNK